jgi:tetratricopeptide (TPR) repeat protein
MKRYFEDSIAELPGLTSPAEVRINVLAITRLLLQQCCYAMVEWLASRPLSQDMLPQPDLLDSLRMPSDGSLVECLEELLYRCERAGWTGVGSIPSLPVDRRSKAKTLCKDRSSNIDGLLRALVEIRNDGGEGHGLPGGFDSPAEIDAVRAITKALTPILPRGTPKSADLLGGPEQASIKLSLIRAWDGGKPALFRKIQTISGRRIRIEAQIKTSMNERKSLHYESDDPFIALVGHVPASFDIFDNGDNDWTPYYYLPARLTETFAGRKEELDALREWLEDSDSRTCMVFGDGGLGKTTLVVEFVTRWLEASVPSKWRPEFISFYTAKRWRWGLDGMEPIRAGLPNTMDLISHLHQLFFQCAPDKGWYRLGVKEAVGRLANKILEEHKIKRDDHLIIIDNAETLIESEQDRERLAAEIKEVSRRLGRVIITSRRREQIEAAPIEVRALSAREAVTLITNRGVNLLKVAALSRASDQELLECVRKMGCRPLVLDAFLRAIADPSSNSISRAVERVNRLLAKDLGIFLFDDAWNRLEREMRQLLLLMVRLGDVHDAVRLRMCCNQASISVGLAEAALEESAGIASVSRFNGQLQIELSQSFMKFAESRTESLDDGTTFPNEKLIAHIKQDYLGFLKSTRTPVADRLPQAFRNPEAKAARAAAAAGRPADAQRYYEQAILSDVANGWLLDRYAHFLLKDMRDPVSAYVRAQRATELLPHEGEVWFTRGLVECRLGQRQEFEGSMEKAEKMGVAPLRCALQRAWGYTRTRPPQVALARKQLDIVRLLMQQDRYLEKNEAEIDRIDERIAFLSAKEDQRRKKAPRMSNVRSAI